MKKNVILGSGLLGLGIFLWSFKAGEEPKMMRYEVIRSVNGKVTVYDTLVPENSTFTAENYLEQLGFAQDKNIEILRVPPMAPVAPMEPMQFQRTFHEGDSQVVVHCMKVGDLPHDSLMVFEFNFDDENGVLNPGEAGEMRIEKNVMIRHIDSLNQEILEIEKFLEVLVIDSLPGFPPMPAGDSTQMVVRTFVINEGDEPAEMEWKSFDGEPTFERHLEEGDRKMDLMVFNDQEDFTLVIISDADQPSPQNRLRIESTESGMNELKVYPNPADKEAVIRLSFEEAAPTQIVITNSAGKVVAEYNVGDISGAYSQTLDVSKWSKGIYLVTVNRPGMKMVEKLVVE